MLSNSLSIKSVFNGDTRRFNLNKSSFVDLMNVLSGLYAPDSVQSVGFEDNEGDFCLISSDAELREAFNVSASMGSAFLKLVVAGSDVPATPVGGVPELLLSPPVSVAKKEVENGQEHSHSPSSELIELLPALQTFLSDPKVVTALPLVIKAGVDAVASSDTAAVQHQKVIEAMLGSSVDVMQHPSLPTLLPKLTELIKKALQRPLLVGMVREPSTAMMAIPLLTPIIEAMAETIKSLDLSTIKTEEDLLTQLSTHLPFDIELLAQQMPRFGGPRCGRGRRGRGPGGHRGHFRGHGHRGHFDGPHHHFQPPFMPVPFFPVLGGNAGTPPMPLMPVPPLLGEYAPHRQGRGHRHRREFPEAAPRGATCSTCESVLEGIYYNCDACSAHLCECCEVTHPAEHPVLKMRIGQPTPVVHDNIQCDGCQVLPIIGVRWKCAICDDYDLCNDCEQKGHQDSRHNASHPLIKFKAPNKCHGRHQTPKQRELHQELKQSLKLAKNVAKENKRAVKVEKRAVKVEARNVAQQAREEHRAAKQAKKKLKQEERVAKQAEKKLKQEERAAKQAEREGKRAARSPLRAEVPQYVVLSAIEPESISPYHIQMEELATMGFTDSAHVETLLQAHSGNIQEVVNVLLNELQ